METFTNLISGIIGAVFGSFATFYIYRHSQYKASRRKLLDRLALLKLDTQGGFDSFGNPVVFGSIKTEAWKESFKDIWTLYNSATDWAPFWKKCKIHKAWCQYKGDTTDGSLPLFDEPKNEEDFIHRIEALAKSL